MRLTRITAAALVAGALVAGCGSGGEKAGPVPPPVGAAVPTWTGGPIPQAPIAQAAWAPPLPRAQPASIKISRLGVSAPVTQLGLRSDGKIEEPPLSRPNLAGWYKEGPTPGEAGPSVILGHVDANRQAAVFHKLKDLKIGDRIQVTRTDGSVATFAVQQVVRVAKSTFPGQQIYGEDLDYSSLRLVTCGGTFDPGRGHYVDNVIAFSRLVDR